MKPLPVLLITGFLGAGKTTFVNQLLDHFQAENKRVALLINEFGRVSIDKDLINDNRQTIYEVNQGSIFCACTRDQFVAALDKIAAADPPFDVAVIESTGIANTADLRKHLSAESFTSRLEIKQNICLIDAANFHKVYATLPAVKSQVEQASVLIINKSDLVDQEQLQKLVSLIHGLNPDHPVEITRYGKADMTKLIDLAATWQSIIQMDETPPDDITSITLVAAKPLDKEEVMQLIRCNAHNLLRGKGFIKTAKQDYFVELVGDRLFTKAMTESKDKISRLVLIGRNLDEKAINAEWKKLFAQWSEV